MSKPHFKRVLLKLSGEALASRSGGGIDPGVVKSLATEIREVHDLGVEIAVVLGGGNIFRGSEEGWMERASADSCGMLATVINGLVLQDALEGAGVYTRVLSAIELHQLAEPYIRRRAIRHMEKKRIVIFTAGTGNPYFTTDTAAALRATEIGAEIILKGTKVDGVFNADPMKNRKARMFSQLSYLECLKRDLKVMDATSISLCRDNKIPIIVFNLFQRGNMKKVVCGSKLGTRVS